MCLRLKVADLDKRNGGGHCQLQNIGDEKCCSFEIILNCPSTCGNDRLLAEDEEEAIFIAHLLPSVLLSVLLSVWISLDKIKP